MAMELDDRILSDYCRCCCCLETWLCIGNQQVVWLRARDGAGGNVIGEEDKQTCDIGLEEGHTQQDYCSGWAREDRSISTEELVAEDRTYIGTSNGFSNGISVTDLLILQSWHHEQGLSTMRFFRGWLTVSLTIPCPSRGWLPLVK